MIRNITTENELRICPRCASENLRMRVENCRKGQIFNVRCLDCHEEGPVDSGYQGAIEAWNTYHPSRRDFKFR